MGGGGGGWEGGEGGKGRVGGRWGVGRGGGPKHLFQQTPDATRLMILAAASQVGKNVLWFRFGLGKAPQLEGKPMCEAVYVLVPEPSKAPGSPTSSEARVHTSGGQV